MVGPAVHPLRGSSQEHMWEDRGQTGRGEDQQSHPERNKAAKKVGFPPPRELFQAPGELPGPPGAPIFQGGFCGNFYSFLGDAVRVAGLLLQQWGRSLQ